MLAFTRTFALLLGVLFSLCLFNRAKLLVAPVAVERSLSLIKLLDLGFALARVLLLILQEGVVSVVKDISRRKNNFENGDTAVVFLKLGDLVERNVRLKLVPVEGLGLRISNENDLKRNQHIVYHVCQLLRHQVERL
jgi:hypothetical protein